MSLGRRPGGLPATQTRPARHHRQRDTVPDGISPIITVPARRIRRLRGVAALFAVTLVVTLIAASIPIR